MNLTPGRWQEVMAVFEAALERAPGARAQFLDHACGSDAAFRHEIETLLAADAAAEGFLEPPVANVGEPLEGAAEGAIGSRARYGIPDRTRAGWRRNEPSVGGDRSRDQPACGGQAPPA